MKRRYTLIYILIVIAVPVIMFTIYGSRYKEASSSASSVSEQSAEAESSDAQGAGTNSSTKRVNLHISWKTILLFGIGGLAMALRFRHRNQLGQQYLDRYLQEQKEKSGRQ